MLKAQKKQNFFRTIYLDEPVTGEAYSRLIMEVVKYVLYQKQQIPLSYDTLTKLFSNSKPADKNFSFMQNLLNTLCNVSEQLTTQFTFEHCDVRKILVTIGPTIVSPKMCIIFEVPDNILSSSKHTEFHHSYRKPLLDIMRNLLEWNELQEELTNPLGPTNTFILVQKKDASKVSNFFIPKPQLNTFTYNANCFYIKLHSSLDHNNACNCENSIKIYNDFSNECYTNSKVINVEIQKNPVNISYQWYQSKEILKGFKFMR